MKLEEENAKGSSDAGSSSSSPSSSSAIPHKVPLDIILIEIFVFIFSVFFVQHYGGYGDIAFVLMGFVMFPMNAVVKKVYILFGATYLFEVCK
jgi:hypothetical protein